MLDEKYSEVRAAAHGRPQLLVLSSTPNATLGASDSISSPQRIENELPAAVPVASPSAVMTPVAVASQVLGASQGLGIEISPAVGIASNSGLVLLAIVFLWVNQVQLAKIEQAHQISTLF
ncbi:hypothetical protein HPP92_012758 [Vanilla planifolia]|uniref:Uncharacterized protein n=1 Tax=Vanilla planifolia TaxID=51239 RepID=A0A835QSS0_VANPL|nr:hypothetical protein HPP92_012758 [Vanilla planifolia]